MKIAQLMNAENLTLRTAGTAIGAGRPLHFGRFAPAAC